MGKHGAADIADHQSTDLNTNPNSMLYCEVPVEGGWPLERGDYNIPGVLGTGRQNPGRFRQDSGQGAGALLPTGNPMDRLTSADPGQSTLR